MQVDCIVQPNGQVWLDIYIRLGVLTTGTTSTIEAVLQTEHEPSLQIRKTGQQQTEFDCYQRLIPFVNGLARVFCYGLRSDDGRYRAALQYYTGGDLFEFVTRPNYDFSQGIHLALQVFEIVASMHASDYTHRDIKLENIFMDSVNNTIVLGDLEFAQPTSSAYIPCGTLGYIAPEIFEDCVVDTSKPDVYACGVLLFLLLFGVYPFGVNGQHRPYQQLSIVHILNELEVQVEQPMVILLDNMLATNASDRAAMKTVVQYIKINFIFGLNNGLI